VAGAPWDAGFVPAAALVIARGVPVAAFAEAADGGTFWGIVGARAEDARCGVHANRRDVDGTGARWTLGAARDAGSDGVYRVGATTASMPAQRVM
jgi:hypothetical protein